jgi:fructose-bisphosphate aldolase class II
LIVTARTLLDAAYGKNAVGHYSVNNMEQVLAVLEGNREARAPFLLAFSKSAFGYASLPMIEGLARAADRLAPDLLFAVHLDHGDEPTCHVAIESGAFSSVMIDGSAFPFEENVAVTSRVVRHAHARGLSVEAELGALRGVEDDIHVEAGHAAFTDPAEAATFVRRTGCDSLAVAVGTVHGPNKFKAGEGIKFDRLAEIARALPGLPLVLHGSSSLPRQELERVNAAGGKVETGTRGVGPDDMRQAVRRGVAKINIDADSRLVWTRVHREFFLKHPDNIDFRKPGREYVKEFGALIKIRSQDLGSAGTLPALLHLVRGDLEPAAAR